MTDAMNQEIIDLHTELPFLDPEIDYNEFIKKTQRFEQLCRWKLEGIENTSCILRAVEPIAQYGGFMTITDRLE